LDAREDEHGLSAVFTNPAVRSPGRKMTLPAQTVILRRRRVVADSLVEALSVSNYGRDEVEVDLRVEFDADFADLFVVKGHKRLSPVPLVHAEASPREVLFRYRGVDAVERTTYVSFHSPPDALAPNEAVFVFRLAPRQTGNIEFEV